MSTTSTSFICRSFLTTLLLFLFLVSTNAQVDANTQKWKFEVAPYIMFPELSGVTTIRNLPEVEVSANANDIFSNLQLGFMLFFEARKGRFALNSDFLYSDLQQDATPATIINSGTSSAREVVEEVTGLYNVWRFLEFGVGARVDYIYSGIDVVKNEAGGGTTPIAASISRTWVDPIIVMRATANIRDKWIFQFRGDIGGFGAGSDLTWQLQGFAGYNIAKWFRLSLGYKSFKINYDKGSGADRFMYNVNMFGPILKLGFHF